MASPAAAMNALPIPPANSTAAPGAGAPPGRRERDRREHRDAKRAANLVPGRVQPRQHAGLLVAGTGEDGDCDRHQDYPKSQAGDEHPGQDVGQIAAVRVGAREQQQARGADGERASHRDTHAAAAHELAAEVGARAGRQGEWKESEPCLERACAEHVLHVERQEQERAEEERRGGEHQREAAADGAVREPLHA